jgi:hypothetical protein
LSWPQAFTSAASAGQRLLNKAFALQDTVMTMVSQLDRALVSKCLAIAERRRRYCCCAHYIPTSITTPTSPPTPLPCFHLIVLFF